jgi:hypothetical protein
VVKFMTLTDSGERVLATAEVEGKRVQMAFKSPGFQRQCDAEIGAEIETLAQLKRMARAHSTSSRCWVEGSEVERLT